MSMSGIALQKSLASTTVHLRAWFGVSAAGGCQPRLAGVPMDKAFRPLGWSSAALDPGEEAPETRRLRARLRVGGVQGPDEQGTFSASGHGCAGARDACEKKKNRCRKKWMTWHP